MQSPSSLRLIAFSLLLFAASLAGYSWWNFVVSKQQVREDILTHSTKRVTQLADVQAQHIEALILGADLALRQFRDAVQYAAPKDDDATLKRTIDSFPPGSVVDFVAVDRQGYVVYPKSLAIKRHYLGDRDFYKYHVGSTQDRLFISKPILGRLKDNWIIPITRPMIGDHGFSGVAIFTLSPEYLSSNLARLDMDPGDAVTLFYKDGTYVARSSKGQDLLGKTVPSDRPFLAANAADHGVFRTVSNVDAVARIFAWARLKGYPLVINVGLDERTILGPVENEIALDRVRLELSIVILLAFATAVFILLLRVARKDEQLAGSLVLLQQSEDTLKKISKHVPGIIFQLRMDRNGKFSFPFVSDALRDLYGLAPEEVRGNASPFFAFRDLDDADGLATSMTESASSLSRWHREYRVVLPGHGVRWRMGDAVPERLEDGSILWHGFITDITDRKNSEDRRRLNSRIVETVGEAIMVTDTDANIVAVNPAFCRITGYSEAEVLGKHPRILNSDRHNEAFHRAMWQSLREDGSWAGEIWNRRKNGEIFPEWQTISCLKDEAGRITQYVAVFADLTEIRKAQEIAEQLSWRDTLTGLANRALFLRQLEKSLSNAHREQRSANVLLLNLDRFKDTNEARGLMVGDEVLKAIAQQFTQVLHEDDQLARLDADEFAVLLPHLATSREQAGREALAVAEKLLAVLRTDIEVDGEHFPLEASIGIALFPENVQETASDVLRQANTAMHQAKSVGGGGIVFFEAAMGQVVKERYRLERDLRQAIEGGELRVFLQPQVNAARQHVGAEALVRWQHPERGLLPPAVFVPVAEGSDLIVELDRWMLTEVCKLLARLDTNKRSIRISVNISPRHFQKNDFVEVVKRILATTGADPSYIVLEVTEGTIVGDLGDVARKMTALSSLGIHFSLDDFGTGYSSLAYLKRLPIHELKIDKSFIDDVASDSNSAALVETILAVAQHLRLRVVAEGVETPQQAEFLNKHGHVIRQGYLYGRPEPAAAWESHLSDWEPTATILP